MPLDSSIIGKTLATPYGENAFKVVDALEDAGYDTWWVGGCVRDMLENHLPKDIDIATAATPEQIMAVFPKAREVPRPLGSARIKMGKFIYEITTFRKEADVSDGRHPESVSFSTREEDAVRRDFTINAIYFHPVSRELYDPHEGEADLKEKLIRFVGEPATRIKHDALRIMRAVRFRARIDGQYHPDTYTALREHAALTEHLSGIRKLEELEKLLMTKNAARGLEDLWELTILRYVLPELYACKGVPQPADYHHEGDVWDHTLKCVESFRDDDNIDVRVAALFHDAGKSETFSLKERIRFDHHATISAESAEKALKRLQMPKKRIEKVSWLIKHHMMMGSFFEMNNESKARWYFHEWFTDLIRLFYLDIAGTEPSDYTLYEKILADYHAFLNAHPRPPKLLLKGEDVMKLLDLKPGKEVGDMLDALQDAQVRGDVATKKEAEAFITSLNPGR